MTTQNNRTFQELIEKIFDLTLTLLNGYAMFAKTTGIDPVEAVLKDFNPDLSMDTAYAMLSVAVMNQENIKTVLKYAVKATKVIWTFAKTRVSQPTADRIDRAIQKTKAVLSAIIDLLEQLN